MNEGITIYLNMEEREFDKNEALIRKIDEFLLNFGIKYAGIRNIYTPIKSRDRDHAVFIPAGNEPSGHASMSIWRLPQGSNTPQLCCAASLMPRSLLRGI